MSIASAGSAASAYLPTRSATVVDLLGNLAVAILGIGFGLVIPAVLFWLTSIASASMGAAVQMSDHSLSEFWIGFTANASPIHWLIGWTGFLVVLLVIILSARLLHQGICMTASLLDRAMTWSPAPPAGATTGKAVGCGQGVSG
jgi:hypothetical protein